MLRRCRHPAAEHVVHLNYAVAETMRHVRQANSLKPLSRPCGQNSRHAFYGSVRTRASHITGDGKPPLSVAHCVRARQRGDMPFS